MRASSTVLLLATMIVVGGQSRQVSLSLSSLVDATVMTPSAEAGDTPQESAVSFPVACLAGMT